MLFPFPRKLLGCCVLGWFKRFASREASIQWRSLVLLFLWYVVRLETWAVYLLRSQFTRKSGRRDGTVAAIIATFCSRLCAIRSQFVTNFREIMESYSPHVTRSEISSHVFQSVRAQVKPRPSSDRSKAQVRQDWDDLNGSKSVALAYERQEKVDCELTVMSD